DAATTSARLWFWNRLYTAREAEFLNLDFGSARFRIRYGKHRLEAAGLLPVGFVAPAWLMNPDVLRAAFDAGMLSTHTVDSIFASSGKIIHSRSLCYSARARWRQVASLVWNSVLWNAKRDHSVVRLSLHPFDITVRLFRSHISAIISQATLLQFQSTTYRDL